MKILSLNMFELIYPRVDFPECQSREDLPLIDGTGTVIGRASRVSCHSGSMNLHPVVHLHLFNNCGQLYLQKRSMKKDVQPGKWDTAVGGHVDYGEKIREALFREAREELGLTGLRPEPLFHYVWHSPIESEMVCAFAATYDGAIFPDMEEVSEGRFWSLSELQAGLGFNLFTPQFEQELPRLLGSATGRRLFKTE